MNEKLDNQGFVQSEWCPKHESYRIDGGRVCTVCVPEPRTVIEDLQVRLEEETAKKVSMYGSVKAANWWPQKFELEMGFMRTKVSTLKTKLAEAEKAQALYQEKFLSLRGAFDDRVRVIELQLEDKRKLKDALLMLIQEMKDSGWKRTDGLAAAEEALKE